MQYHIYHPCHNYQIWTAFFGWGFFRQISEGVVLFSMEFMFKQSCSGAVLYQVQGFKNAGHVSRCPKQSKTYLRHLI